MEEPSTRGPAQRPAQGPAPGPAQSPVQDPVIDPAEDPVETLERWTQFGAAWEVLLRTPGQVTVSLLRCDGGEEVSRLVSEDPALLAYVDRQR